MDGLRELLMALETKRDGMGGGIWHGSATRARITGWRGEDAGVVVCSLI